MRLLLCVCSIFLMSLALAAVARSEENSVRWTGWFSDEKCASARAAATAPGTALKRAPHRYLSASKPGRSSGSRTIHRSSRIWDTTLKFSNVKRLAYQGPACARRKASSEK